MTMTSHVFAFKRSLQIKVKTDICKSLYNEVSQEGSNAVRYSVTVAPKWLVYLLKKECGKKKIKQKIRKCLI